MKKSLLLLFGIVFGMFVIMGGVSATTYYVATDGNDTTGNGNSTHEWLTIKKALTILAANDILIVRDGIYIEEENALDALYIDSSTYGDDSITIQSENKWGATLIVNDTDADGTSQGMLYINSYNVTIDGLIFDGKSPTFTQSQGVQIRSSADNITIKNSKFLNLSSLAITVASAATASDQPTNILLENNEAYNMTFTSLGLGYLNNFTVRNNTVDFQGAIVTKYFVQKNSDGYVFGFGNMLIENNTILATSSKTYHYGIYSTDGSSMNGATIRFNTFGLPGKTFSGYGIRYDNVSGLVIENNKFFVNKDQYLPTSSYGIWGSEGRNITIRNNTFGNSTNPMNITYMAKIDDSNNSLMEYNVGYGIESNGFTMAAAGEQSNNAIMRYNNVTMSNYTSVSYLLQLGSEGVRSYDMINATMHDNIAITNDTGGSTHSIMLGYTVNSTVYNNYAQGGAYGYVIKGNDNCNVSFNRAYNNSFVNIYDKAGHNCIFVKNTGYQRSTANMNFEAFWNDADLRYTTNSTWYDNIILSSASNPLLVGPNSSMIVINTSFTTGAISVDTSGNLTRQWWYISYPGQNGDIVPIYNSTGYNIANVTADSTGNTSRYALTEYIVDDGTITYYNNHTAVFDGYTSQINLTKTNNTYDTLGYTIISGCQALSASGRYALNQSVVPSANYPAVCFSFGADNIILDFNQYTIINDTYNSVVFSASSARSNITIKEIGQFRISNTIANAYGIDFALNSNNVTIKNSLFNNSYLLVRDRGFNNWNFLNNTFTGTIGTLALYYSSTTTTNLTFSGNIFDNIVSAHLIHFAGNTERFNFSNNKIINMNDLSYDLIYNTKVANNAIFENNNFTQNTNVYPVSGGSYFYYGYGGNLTNSIFRKNSVSDVGIYSFYTTGNAGKSFNVTFEDSTFNRINTSSLIITATGGENITVRNNTFNEIRNGSVIVHLYGITRANATNNTFSNNGKNINALVYIYYSGGTSNSSISFNNFIDNTPTSYGGVTGIYLTDANTTEIFNNTWRNSTAYYSIQISGPSYYIKTYYNNASCVDGGGSHGIIYRQVYYGEIYNNTVSDCNFGILFHNGSRHNVGYDNKIESTAVGVYIIDDAVNNTFANSTLNGVGTSISVYRYDDRGNLPPANNTVYNVVINGSTGANIQGVNASNERGYNTFRDVIISNSAVANLIALTQNSTSLILTNVTSNVNGESVPAGSSYTRKWYVEASSNIAGTNLTLSNATGVLYTNSSPNFAKQTVTSYINNGGTRTNYSNYSITASADGYATNTTEINLTDNVDLSFTLVENIVPQVTINSPTASQTFTTSSVLLNVTLNENGTCLYSTNSGTTNNSMDTSDNLTFTKTLSSLSDRSYTANFYCNDSVGNRNDTINVSFSVAVPVAENPATSNSGSPIYSPTETNLEQGYSKSLGQNWEISFKSGSENHRLKVNKVYNQNKTATITISSSPQTKTLVVGEEWKVNLNEDNYYDLSIRLNDIKNNLANVTIKSINETISFEKEEVTETNNPIEQESSEEEKTKGINYLFYILIIILAVVVALSYFIYNKVKRRY